MEEINKLPKSLMKDVMFIDTVVSKIDENGIVDQEQMFEIYKSFRPKTLWYTELFEELSNLLIKSGKVHRILIELDKPSKVYANRHRYTTISFYVRKKENGDYTEKTEESRRILQQLINDQNEARKEKKVVITKKGNMDFKHTRQTLYAKYGYISKKRVAQNILHKYLVKTFGFSCFSINDIMNLMPLSLVATLVGFEIPDFFKIKPELMNLSLESFPNEFISDVIDITFTTAYIEDLLQNIVGKIQGTTPLVSDPEKNVYKCYRFCKVDFCGIVYDFDFIYSKQVDLFWNIFYCYHLINSSDSNLFAFWKKRYSADIFPIEYIKWQINRYSESGVNEYAFSYFDMYRISLLVCSDLIHTAHTFSHISSSSKVKYDYSKLLTIMSLRDDFKVLPSYHFDENNSFEYEFVKSRGPVSFLNYLASLYCLTGSGIISYHIIKWNVLYSILNKYFTLENEWQSRSLSSFHSNHMKIKYYNDLFCYNVATNSYNIREFITSDKFIFLSTSQYLKRMNIDKLCLTMNYLLGETLERAKTILLSKQNSFSNITEYEFLYSINSYDDAIKEVLIALKYSRFHSAKDGKFKIRKSRVVVLNPKKPQQYFDNIRSNIENLKNSRFDNISIDNKISSTPGTLVFLLVSDLVDISDHALSEHQVITISTSTRMPVLHNKMVNMFSFSIKKLSLPNLPSLNDTSNDMTMPDMLSDKPCVGYNILLRDLTSYLRSSIEKIKILTKSLNIFNSSTQMKMLCFLHSQIFYTFSHGIYLEELVETNKPSNMNIYELILFLESFGLIYQVHSTNSNPVFVADTFASPHLVIQSYRKYESYHLKRHHIWIDINGELNRSIMFSLYTVISDYIHTNSGCEVEDLLDFVNSTSIKDIIDILDIMEADEVIYSWYQREVSDALIGVKKVSYKRVSNIEYLSEFSRELKDPTYNRVKRFLFIAEDHITNSSQVLST